MLKAEKKIVLCVTKQINILTLVLSEKKFLNKTKNHNPPCKLNGRSLNIGVFYCNKIEQACNYFFLSFRDRPFNLQGGLRFFVSFRNFFPDNTRVRIFIFFVAQSAKILSRIQH